MTSEHYKEEYLLPNNKYIEDCEFVPEHPFMHDYVSQVVESTGNLFEDICDRLDLNSVRERQLVQKKKLDNRSITKAKLIEWLENACYLLDTCANSLLQKAAKKVEKTEQLLEEKIDDQKSIIELQQKLLNQKEEGLKCVETDVQTAVQEELKSVKTTSETGEELLVCLEWHLFSSAFSKENLISG